MGQNVYVKIVGFKEVERHAINTLLRLSSEGQTSYSLWSPDAPVAPHLILMDVDSYEAGLEMASPGFATSAKLICVGEGAPEDAWRTFDRPLHWPDVIRAMDALFEDSAPIDLDFDFQGTQPDVLPPAGVKSCLMVDPSRDDRLYFRARLALAGLCDFDEAQSAAEALECVRRKHYCLVLVGPDVPDMETWELCRQLVTLEPAADAVVLISTDTAWHLREKAEQAGCKAVLDKPYNPLQIIQLLQTI